MNNLDGGYAIQKTMTTKTKITIGIIIGALCAVFIGTILMASMVLIIVGRANHDLAGTYYTNDYFPIDTITFNKNGKVVAYGDGDEYKGRYRKRRGAYYIEFTGADSIISNAQAHMFELKATKQNDEMMYFEVIPITDYYGWLGVVVPFYKE